MSAPTPVAMEEAMELVAAAGRGGPPNSSSLTVHDDVVSLKKQVSSALRDGDTPDYASRDILALLAQYISVGLMIGAMQQFSYPIFIAYYHMEGSQFNAATALMGLGWSLKVFVGILSDCAPLFGYRRKSYMILGW
ncbi:hypothetical protein B5M09_013991, partial [Aphanomyces astaci]